MTSQNVNRTKALYFSLGLCIILIAYYQLKPLSRSLFITYLGSAKLPYVWIATTVILTTLVPFFHWRLIRYPLHRIVSASCLSFMLLLLFARYVLIKPNPQNVVGFYVLVDVYSVILIENFWSLANSIFRAPTDKTNFAIIGSGGLLGGTIGSLIASSVLDYTGISVADLLFGAIFFLSIFLVLSRFMRQQGFYDNSPLMGPKSKETLSDERLLDNLKFHYILLLVLLLLCSQLVEPIVEYQLMGTLEATISDLKERTQFLSLLFAVLGVFALVINLLITPFIYRHFGIIWGYAVQPAVVGLSVILFGLFPTLRMAAFLKLADRGLNYSIGRASKELLYGPLQTALMYRSKIWIDIYGYRVFKIVGSLLILGLTHWAAFGKQELNWVLLGITVVWGLALLKLRTYYCSLSK